MKKVQFLLLLVFGINSAFADCGLSGMQFFPKQEVISVNSMFIIEGYRMNRQTVNNFKDRAVYLESENGMLIELNLQEIHHGKWNLSQAIFEPSLELLPNTTYFLKLANQTDLETREMKRWNSDQKKSVKVYWRTTDEKITEDLNPSIDITFEGTDVVYFGCGPSANAIFKFNNETNSEIWFKTEVIDLVTNEKTTYYLSSNSGKIRVGHGMCAGAFTFNEKRKYKVRFTPMNMNGKTLETTEWKTFDSPYKDDKGPFEN